MAIGDDFSVATNGDIRHVSGTTTYTGLELYRWLQDLADDEGSSGNDYVDIVTLNPASRSTDQIFTLLDYSGSGGPTFNIDDDAAEYLYDCSFTQKGGDEVYSGLQVLGAVNDSSTQIMIIQDNGLYQFFAYPGDAVHQRLKGAIDPHPRIDIFLQGLTIDTFRDDSTIGLRDISAFVEFRDHGIVLMAGLEPLGQIIDVDGAGLTDLRLQGRGQLPFLLLEKRDGLRIVIQNRDTALFIETECFG